MRQLICCRCRYTLCRHHHLTCALWQIAAGALGTDILKVVEAQPALLLQQASPLDDEVRLMQMPDLP